MKILHIYRKSLSGQRSKSSGTYLNPKQPFTKQPFNRNVFYDKAILIKFPKFIRKQLCRSFFFNKILRLQSKERFLHRYFLWILTNILEQFRISFLFSKVNLSHKKIFLWPWLFKYFRSKHCESLANSLLRKS